MFGILFGNSLEEAFQVAICLDIFSLVVLALPPGEKKRNDGPSRSFEGLSEM
jgi:hypothetical protein